MKKFILIFGIVAFSISCGNNSNQNESAVDTTEVSPSSSAAAVITNTNFPERVYWGDQHTHTGWSGDAAGAGTTIGPEEAVRFAMGNEVKNNSGQMIKLARPLDWLVVSDHSDGLGAMSSVVAGDPETMKDTLLKRWHDGIASGDPAIQKEIQSDIVRHQSSGKIPKSLISKDFLQSVWEKNTAIQDKYNKPGSFTAFIGYEWTSNYGGGNNMHRNIIFRDNAAVANKMTPLTTFVTEDPEGLWKWMQEFEDKTGGKILAIPHNGNMSNGLMFSLTTLAGKPITKEYAETRQKWEVLYEVTQVKGTSEVHPSISPTDEFANFELWDKGNLGYQKRKKPGMIETEYLREALKNGIKLEQQLGVNPFKYGIAGGTDTHTGLPTADNDNFNGKFKVSEQSKERWEEVVSKYEGGIQRGWELGASGWTGVWATSNTREAIWDAMKRRETYATTGPRMTVRFFGGYDYNSDDLNAADMPARGYNKGVPMGGDLAGTSGKKPVFMISALKDPTGANLDRVQVIKGWVDKNGKKQEKIFEVVWGDADKRKLDAKGKLPSVGNTVDLANATVENSIGDAELKTVWTDPEFDPAIPCFYYLRVLEIPTPRWTAYDAKKYGVKMGKEVPMISVERCYSSPIWYTPIK
ncbi:MAG: DUF3604 domain-containing protein [Chitinophagaceae bacterium]